MSTLPPTELHCKPGRVFLTIRFDPAERRKLKLLAAEQDTSVTAIVTEAIHRFLEEEGGARRMSSEGAPHHIP